MRDCALLLFFVPGLTLLASAGCIPRSPSAETRKDSIETPERRIAAFRAANPYATVGVVNAVIPERHVLQVQGISPQSVEIGQAIEVVADNDLRNPIHATVYDRQLGYVQLGYPDDGGRPRIPKAGDIAFCYVPKPAEPQLVASTKKDKSDLKVLANGSTNRSLASLPPEPTGVIVEAPATRPASSVDLKRAAPKPIQVVREVPTPTAPASRPALPPAVREAVTPNPPMRDTPVRDLPVRDLPVPDAPVPDALESSPASTQLVAESHVAAPGVVEQGPAPAKIAEPAEDLRSLIGVQLPGLRRVEIPKLPVMSVQGYVHVSGGEPMALIEVGDTHRVYLVQVGAEIPIAVYGRMGPVGNTELTGLAGPKGSGTPPETARNEERQSQVILKVKRITSEGVILETGLAQTLIVR